MCVCVCACMRAYVWLICIFLIKFEGQTSQDEKSYKNKLVFFYLPAFVSNPLQLSQTQRQRQIETQRRTIPPIHMSLQDLTTAAFHQWWHFVKLYFQWTVLHLCSTERRLWVRYPGLQKETNHKWGKMQSCWSRIELTTEALHQSLGKLKNQTPHISTVIVKRKSRLHRCAHCNQR